jgi:hypothetical protein
MDPTDTAVLIEELEQFRREKEQIRKVVGRIGGKASAKRDKVINAVFVIAIVALFSVDFLRHLLGFSIALPPLFSIELGVLFVSMKIIWMIHKQAKVEHFQFWILNSIEFRLNDVAKRMRDIDQRLT